MEHSSFNNNFNTICDYEIFSHVEEDIYFETEILCEGIKENLVQLKDKESNVITNTYMQHCLFLIDDVLEYIRFQRKTTIHFVRPGDETTSDICRMIHLKEIESSQRKIMAKIDNFKEASTFMFPGYIYPAYLFPLKAKMKFIDIYMDDLFYLEKTKIHPQVIEQPNALKFEASILN